MAAMSPMTRIHPAEVHAIPGGASSLGPGGCVAVDWNSGEQAPETASPES